MALLLMSAAGLAGTLRASGTISQAANWPSCSPTLLLGLRFHGSPRSFGYAAIYAGKKNGRTPRLPSLINVTREISKKPGSEMRSF